MVSSHREVTPSVHPYDKIAKSARIPGKATPTLYPGVQLGPFMALSMNGSLAALHGGNCLAGVGSQRSVEV